MSMLGTATIIDAMIDGVTITDMSGGIINFNRAASEMTGYEKSEAIGKTPAELFLSEEDIPKFHESIPIMLSGKPIEASDYLIRRKDGTKLQLSINLSVLRDTDGRPSAIVAVHRDIRNTGKE